MDRLKSYKNKTFVQNMITIGMVVVCYAVIQALIATGNINSLMKGILVPICTYVILAVSLNLTVGILGELSLGHAGFMCVGAFSGAFFTNLMADAIPNTMVRFVFAILIGAAVAALFGFLIGIPVLRLKGDYLAIVTLAFGEIIKNIINSMFVGVDGAGKQEMEPEIFAMASKVVCDSIAQCLARGETRNAIQAGCLKEEDIYGEIGELVLGKKSGRDNDEEITIFDTTGMGIQDNTTAEAIYKVALEKGMGSWFEFI